MGSIDAEEMSSISILWGEDGSIELVGIAIVPELVVVVPNNEIEIFGLGVGKPDVPGKVLLMIGVAITVTVVVA